MAHEGLEIAVKRVELLEERDKRKEENSRAFLSVARAWRKFWWMRKWVKVRVRSLRIDVLATVKEYKHHAHIPLPP